MSPARTMLERLPCSQWRSGHDCRVTKAKASLRRAKALLVTVVNRCWRSRPVRPPAATSPIVASVSKHWMYKAGSASHIRQAYDHVSCRKEVVSPSPSTTIVSPRYSGMSFLMSCTHTRCCCWRDPHCTRSRSSPPRDCSPLRKSCACVLLRYSCENGGSLKQALHPPYLSMQAPEQPGMCHNCILWRQPRRAPCGDGRSWLVRWEGRGGLTRHKLLASWAPIPLAWRSRPWKGEMLFIPAQPTPRWRWWCLELRRGS